MKRYKLWGLLKTIWHRAGGDYKATLLKLCDGDLGGSLYYFSISVCLKLFISKVFFFNIALIDALQGYINNKRTYKRDN